MLVNTSVGVQERFAYAAYGESTLLNTDLTADCLAGRKRRLILKRTSMLVSQPTVDCSGQMAANRVPKLPNLGKVRVLRRPLWTVLHCSQSGHAFFELFCAPSSIVTESRASLLVPLSPPVRSGIPHLALSLSKPLAQILRYESPISTFLKSTFLHRRRDWFPGTS